jgi:D-alanyl-D-alanine dipeptidase
MLCQLDRWKAKMKKKQWLIAVGVMVATALPGQTARKPASAPLAGSIVDDGRSQLFGQRNETRPLGPEPIAVQPALAGLIGEYGWDVARFYVLEEGGQLKILSGWFDFEVLRPASADKFQLSASGPHGAAIVVFQRDTKNVVTGVEIAGTVYPRRAFMAAGEVYQITPLKPVPELRKEALAAKPPSESGNFRKPDLVELNRIDPTIKLDVRYATSRNFLGAPLYLQQRAYMQRPAAEAVARVSQRLHSMGYGLLVHDAYRPWYVTKMFWDGTPNDKKIFVADPAKGSRHNRGCAVDLTLYDLKTGQPIEMTGGYDEMSERSYAFYPGGTSRQRWHRDLLRRAMEAEGFSVFESEWWHFDYKDWTAYPILNLTFEQLEKKP